MLKITRPTPTLIAWPTLFSDRTFPNNCLASPMPHTVCLSVYGTPNPVQNLTNPAEALTKSMSSSRPLNRNSRLRLKFEWMNE